MADLRYRPACQHGPHLPVSHAERLRDCACPCHQGNEANPWWKKFKARRPNRPTKARGGA